MITEPSHNIGVNMNNLQYRFVLLFLQKPEAM